MNVREVVEDVNFVEGEGRKLRLREKVAAVIAAGTGTFHSQVIQMFLLFFYTDMVGIGTSYVAVLFLITRILDACFVPFFGMLIDKLTIPLGKYKPWLVGIEVLVAISGWLTFTSFNLSVNGKYVYITITYTIYSLFLSIKQVPGSAIIPIITKRIDDRISMNQISYIFVVIAAMFVISGVQPLYKFLGGSNSRGFSLIMAVAAAIGMLIAAFQWCTIKERYIIATINEHKNKPILKEIFIAVVTNKTAVIAYIYVFATSLATGIKSAITIYYFKYYFHDEGLLATMGIIGLLPSFIGIALSPKVTKIIGIRANLVISVIINVVTMAAIIAVPATSTGVTIYAILLIVGSFFTGLSAPAQGIMMPAAMDYTEWKSRLNINGFMSSFQGFLQNLATALAGSIAASTLTIIGYEQGSEQSSMTIYGIKLLMSIVPACIALITISVAGFDLTENKQNQIAKELEERRKYTKSNVAAK